MTCITHLDREIAYTPPAVDEKGPWGSDAGGCEMTKTGLAIVAATLAASAVVILPGLSPTVEAGVVAQKGDRLDLTVRMASCLQRGWPYDQACSKHSGRPVRLVTTDRL